MLLKTKVFILSFTSIMLLIAFFMMSNIYGRITIALLIAFKYSSTIILFLKSKLLIKEEKKINKAFVVKRTVFKIIKTVFF